MIKMFTLTITVLFLCKGIGYAQKTFEESFGGLSNGEWQDDLKKMKRNGYLVTGSTDNFGVGSSDAYCIRLNGQGRMLWSKTYGTALSEGATKCYGTSDGGFLLSFSSHRPGGSKDSCVFILKCDEDGSVQWSKCIQDIRAGSYRPASLYESRKGEFYLLYDWNTSMYYGQKFALLKFSRSGALIWQRHVDTQPLSVFGCVQVGEQVDGDIIVCGNSWGDNWGTYGSYIHLFRFAQSNGMLELCKKICYGNCGSGTNLYIDNFIARDTSLYINGGFSNDTYDTKICWFSLSTNNARINANYIKVIDYSNNGVFHSYQYLINKHLMQQPEQGYNSILNFTPDGGYLNAYRYSAGNPTYYDIIVDKHDSLGLICPKFTIPSVDTVLKGVSFHITGQSYTILDNLITIKDSLVSITEVKAQRGLCEGSRTVSADETSNLPAVKIGDRSNKIWSVYPNPAKSFVTIKYQLNKPAAIEFRVMTTGGKTVFRKSLFAVAGNQQTALDIQSLPPGVYFIQIIAGDKTQTLRFVKE